MSDICPICEVSPKKVTKTGKLSQYCQPCGRRADKAWKTNNPERWAELQWRARIKRVFGLSHEDFSLMLAQQGGKCPICDIELDTKIYQGKCGANRACIDHDHVTGTVRGILCNLCNVALGSMRDRPELLRRAAHYLDGNYD